MRCLMRKAVAALLIVLGMVIACGEPSRTDRLTESGIDPTDEASFAYYAAWYADLYTGLLLKAQQDGADALTIECFSLMVEIYTDWRPITDAEEKRCESVIGETTVEEPVPATADSRYAGP